MEDVKRVCAHAGSVKCIHFLFCRKQKILRSQLPSRRRVPFIYLFFCKWEGLQAEGNKRCSVERDDLHILVWSVHSYRDWSKTMIPLNDIFSLVFFLLGKKKARIREYFWFCSVGLNSISAPTRKFCKTGPRISFFVNSNHFSHVLVHPCSVEGDEETVGKEWEVWDLNSLSTYSWCLPCSALTVLTFLLSTHYAVSCSKALGNTVPFSGMLLSLLIA